MPSKQPTEPTSVETATAKGLTNYDTLMGLLCLERLAGDPELPPSRRLAAMVQKIDNMLKKGGWRHGPMHPEIGS